jgi:hypothetical protein
MQDLEHLPRTPTTIPTARNVESIQHFRGMKSCAGAALGPTTHAGPSIA